MLKKRNEAVLDLYNLLLGFFLFLSPGLFAFASDSVRMETWVVAALLVAVSSAALVAFKEWEEWLIALLGAWLIISPWVLGFAHTTAMHVSTIIGCVVLYLALLELWLIHDERSQHVSHN